MLLYTIWLFNQTFLVGSTCMLLVNLTYIVLLFQKNSKVESKIILLNEQNNNGTIVLLNHKMIN